MSPVTRARPWAGDHPRQSCGRSASRPGSAWRLRLPGEAGGRRGSSAAVVSPAAAAGRMAHSRLVCRRRRRPAPADPGFDATEDMAHRPGDTARAAPQRPRLEHQARPGRCRVPDHLHDHDPRWHAPAKAVEGAEAGEAARAHELAGQGHLERLWILPGQGRALGVCRARDSAEMEASVRSLPLDPWMTTELPPLTPHLSDPATTST